MIRCSNVLVILFHKSGKHIRSRDLGSHAERDLRKSLVQTPARCKSAVRSDQVSEGFIQSDLGILQGWILHSLSGQSIRLPDCPQGEKNSPYTQCEPLSFKCMPFAADLLAVHCCEELGSIFSVTSLQVIGGILLGPPSSGLFSELNQPPSLRFFSQGKRSSSDHHGLPRLNLLLFANVFLVVGGPKLVARF